MLQKRNRNRLFLIAIMLLLVISPFGYERPALLASASDEGIELTTVESASLDEKIEQILSDPKLAGSIAGVTVADASTGETMYTHMGDIRLRPASNMKLLTGAAAMEVLGPDYSFSTEVLTDGLQKWNTLTGNLYLRGRGDPTLMKEDLDQFAKDLKASGIDRISGSLIADSSYYDDVPYSQDLNWSDEHNYVGAQVSALTLSPNDDYDAGTVIVEVNAAASKDGQPLVTVTPETASVEIVNNAKMVAKDEKKTISITREHGSDKIIVEGNMPVEGTRSRSWTAVWNPSGLALHVFANSLKEAGIELTGAIQAENGVTPAKARVLAVKESMPLSELFIPFMKLSNNGHAETLIKEMGKVEKDEGSWDAGLMVLAEKLKEFGVNTDAVVLRDGSGMSHKNLISPDELTALLYAIQNKDWFPAFEASLPVAGNEDRMVGGTLRNRLKDSPAAGNVKAKTGSLTGVSTLSGYVTAKDGTGLIFSVMLNNFVSGPVTPIEDAIAKALAEYDGK